MSSDQMVLGPEAFDCGIQKSLIHAGKTPIGYVDGTKVYFHFKSVIKEDGTVIDDSKKLNEKKPMELIIGKKFKLEIWEKALRTMWLNEVAKFSVVKELLRDYPIVAKQLREYYEKTTGCSHEQKKCDHSHGHGHGHSHSHHSCGFNIMEHGLGYSDLDVLLKAPKDMEFIFELLRVEQPGEYQKESWTLTDEERMQMIPRLKEEGNVLFKQAKYEQARDKYKEALGFLEQFMLREKPNDVEWNELNETKIPILFNYCFCKYNLGDYYGCIEDCTSLLESKPTNVKALFRRGKAHAAVLNVEEARQDFEKCRQLDESLSGEVKSQLEYLSRMQREHAKELSEKFRGKMFN